MKRISVLKIMAALAMMLNVCGPASAKNAMHIVINDHLGTPQMLVDEYRNVVWKAEYDEFGKANILVEKVEFNLRFPGQYYDKETGLHYNYYRDYDPALGRYVQSDPIGLGGGINTYGYVGGNPVSYVDPFGLRTEITIWQPVGWGNSSFGHVSTEINGTVYSYGKQGMWVGSAKTYYEKNDFRDGQGTVLPITPEQEVLIEQCLNRDHGEYDTISNNCGSPIQNCLKEIGIDTGDEIFPVNLGHSLMDNGATIDDKTQHPETNPSTGTNAPWAR